MIPTGILFGSVVVTALMFWLHRLRRAQHRIPEFRQLPVLWTSRGLEARERRGRP